MNSYDILAEMGKLFERKIGPDFSCSVLFDIKDSGELITVKVTDGRVTIKDETSDEVDIKIETKTSIIEDIYNGKITAFTAAGKGKPSDPAPLDWSIGRSFTPAKMKNIYHMLMHFFHTEEPEVIKLGEEYSRIVHGGHAIPLYYNPGFRSSWYMIKKGERLNEPGETDPFHQGIVVIDGEGYAKIGDKTVEIKKNESYYIPPNSDQVLWTDSDEPLVIIWLAWGEGA